MSLFFAVYRRGKSASFALELSRPIPREITPMRAVRLLPAVPPSLLPALATDAPHQHAASAPSESLPPIAPHLEPSTDGDCDPPASGSVPPLRQRVRRLDI